MRSAAADNDRRAPEESPDRSGRDSSPSTSPIDLIDESLIEDVSLMAGKGPISERRCVRRRRCLARKPRWILGRIASLCGLCLLLGQSSGNACSCAVSRPRLPTRYSGGLLASHFCLASTWTALNAGAHFSQWQDKIASSRRAAFPWRNALARGMRRLV